MKRLSFTINKKSFLQSARRMGLSFVGILTSLVLLLGQISIASAQIPPVLQSDLQARNVTTGSGFSDFTVASANQRLEVQVIVTNPTGSQTATGITTKVTIPQGTQTTTNLNLAVTSSNAAPVSDNTTIQVFNPGGGLFYVPGSTRVTWDTSGDGIHEFLNTVWQDGIAANGLVMGNVLGGGNITKIRLTFLVDVLPPGQVPDPVPTPTPTPPPTDGQTTPPSNGGSGQGNNQSPTVTVNPSITNTNTNNIVIAKELAQATPATTSAQVFGTKDVLPKTGPFAILATATVLFGLITLGIWARKFGELPIRKFAQNYAIKIAQGKNLTENDLVDNRTEAKRLFKV